eukprot:179043-Amphidinium_carterae.1
MITASCLVHTHVGIISWTNIRSKARCFISKSHEDFPNTGNLFSLPSIHDMSRCRTYTKYIPRTEGMELITA